MRLGGSVIRREQSCRQDRCCGDARNETTRQGHVRTPRLQPPRPRVNLASPPQRRHHPRFGLAGGAEIWASSASMIAATSGFGVRLRLRLDRGRGRRRLRRLFRFRARLRSGGLRLRRGLERLDRGFVHDDRFGCRSSPAPRPLHRLRACGGRVGAWAPPRRLRPRRGRPPAPRRAWPPRASCLPTLRAPWRLPRGCGAAARAFRSVRRRAPAVRSVRCVRDVRPPSGPAGRTTHRDPAPTGCGRAPRCRRRDRLLHGRGDRHGVHGGGGGRLRHHCRRPRRRRSRGPAPAWRTRRPRRRVRHAGAGDGDGRGLRRFHRSRRGFRSVRRRPDPGPRSLRSRRPRTRLRPRRPRRPGHRSRRRIEGRALS